MKTNVHMYPLGIAAAVLILQRKAQELIRNGKILSRLCASALKNNWFAALAALCLSCGPGAAAAAIPAQAILFERYDVAANRLLGEQLAIINPDGTGEDEVPVNLPEWGFPTWSKDGRLLALTSLNPTTPFAFSRNVFVLDMQTAQIIQITQFADRANSGSGEGGSATVSACTLPWFKAFSPDKTRMAVAALEFTGISWSAPNTNSPGNPNDLYSGFKGTPVLRVYRMNGATEALVATGGSGANTIHAGDGVDWAPDQDLLVFPKDTQIKIWDSFGQMFIMPLTALVLMPPVDDAIGRGKATQLTFPQATVNQSWSGPVSTWQTDFQPAFSPSGRQVAYVRADNTMSGAFFLAQTHTIRLVNTDGSNDHAILSFDRGKYVSHLSWAPNGEKLAFDLGQEAFTSGGLPMTMADPATCSLWTVNVDGSGLKQLRAGPSAWPAWYPGPAIGSPATPRLDIGQIRQPGGTQIVLSWPIETANIILQRSTSLGAQAAWATEPTQPAVVGSTARVTLNISGTTRFYRLKQP
jgi:hypothetical protein